MHYTLNVADLICCFLSIDRSIVVGCHRGWRGRFYPEESLHLGQVDRDVMMRPGRPDVALLSNP